MWYALINILIVIWVVVLFGILIYNIFYGKDEGW